MKLKKKNPNKPINKRKKNIKKINKPNAICIHSDLNQILSVKALRLNVNSRVYKFNFYCLIQF